MHTFVVVTGLPGSGKTTLAAALAEKLGLEHLDKDRFLEAHFVSGAEVTSECRNKLSREADRNFRARALSLNSAVLSSWWRHPRAVKESGTPVNWLLSSEVRVLEVFCQCPVEVAARRFKARKRHAGHLDVLRSQEQLLEQLAEAESLGPLFLGYTLVCNTELPLQPASVSKLAHQIRAFEGAPSEA